MIVSDCSLFRNTWIIILKSFGLVFLVEAINRKTLFLILGNICYHIRYGHYDQHYALFNLNHLWITLSLIVVGLVKFGMIFYYIV